MKRLVLFFSLACLLALCLAPTALAVSAPTITTIIPASAPNDGDTPVVITGTGFATDGTGTIPPTVTLGTTPLLAVTFVSDAMLTATVPLGMAPGVYDLTVTNPDTGTATLSAAFTVTVPPTLSSLDVSSAYNDIDTAVTITGTDFAAGAGGTVMPAASLSNTASGSVPLTNVAFVDSATLTATVPWGMDPGTYDLTVTNPDGGSATLAAAFTVDKGIGQWNGGKLYGGATGVQMKPGDGTTLYASGDGVGVFRSTDAGGQWSFIGGDLGIQAVVLDPLHPTWLYAEGGETAPSGFGLYRSEDEGDTWTYLSGEPNGNGVTCAHVYPSPYHPKVLFMAISGWDSTALGLKKSTDLGATWSVVDDMKGYSVDLMAFHPTDSGKMVLVTTDGKVFQSTDGGDHWSQVAKPPVGDDAGPDLITYNPYRPAEVWICWFDSVQVTKSTGDPISGWQDVSSGLTTPWLRFTSADEVYMTGGHSTDGGLHWGASYSQEILVDPADPQICFRSDLMYGAMKSTDGGATWTPSNQGLAAMYCNSMAVSPSNPERVFATFFAWPGVFRSDDGTSNWTYLPIPDSWGAAVPCVREDPFDPQRLYAALGNGLFVSPDEGESWTPLGWNTVPVSIPEGPSDCFETDPFYPGHLLVALRDITGTAHMYSSTDSGVSWQAVDLPSALDGLDKFTGLAFAPDTAGLVYLTTPGKGVYRSTDDGTSWRRIDDRNLPMAGVTADRAIAIATNPQQVLWVGTEGGGPFASFDGGGTWQHMDLDDDECGVLMFVGYDSRRMYSGTPIGLFFSSDLGHAFTRAAGVLGRLHITVLGSAMEKDHMIIYAATTGGEVHTGVTSAAAVGTRSAAATAGTFVGGGVYRWTVAISRVTLQLGGLTNGALRRGHAVVATGLVTPERLVGGKVGLTVQRMKAGRWVTVKAVTRTIGVGGVYGWKYRPSKRGAYRLRATIARTSTHTSAKTARRTFKVR